MQTYQEKYPPEISKNDTLWHQKGKFRPYRPHNPHAPVIPIDTAEQSRIEKVESALAALPPYADLEKAAITENKIVDISEHLSLLPDGYFPFLESDTHPISEAEDKPLPGNPVYYRENWRSRVGTDNDIIQRFEKGLAISMGVCDRFGDTIRQRVLWYGAYGIMLDCDEFNDGTEEKQNRPAPCWSMDELLQRYPQLTEITRYIIPSSRSLFEGRPFKARAFIPFEIPVYDYRVFQRIGDKLNEMFPFLPQGVTKNGIVVAFGAAHNASEARHLNGYLSREFIQTCADEVIEQTKQQNKDAQQRQERNKKLSAERKERDNLKSELKAKGHDVKETISPIEAFIAAVNPVDFMMSEGWITHLGGDTYHWHESREGKSCEIISNGNGYIIKPFSNSMQEASPKADKTKPVNAHRFLLYNLYGLDVKKDTDKKQLRKLLVEKGYGTPLDKYRRIQADIRKIAKAEGLDQQSTNTLLASNDEEFVQSILDDTLDTPDIEIIDTPAYTHWTPEQRILCEKVICRDPDDGWYQNPTGAWTPAVVTKYQYLHKVTHLEPFKMNGQPPNIEKRRIFFTQPGVCPKCNDVAALSIDKVQLTAHAYCPKCHKDTVIGSYLNYELKRKVPNPVVSKNKGFLGDNPDFQDFELFRPGQLTYLGAAMATGKTTEIVKAIIQFVKTHNRRGIICVPRISLARAIAHFLRQKYGDEAWGLWHEGSGWSNQFIGTHGAIVCLPSLPRVVAEAKELGLEMDNLLIAIDELDFSYLLLNLATATKLRTKDILREAVNTNGLCVAGQTESTLALEAFASELGLSPDGIHGFYNTADTAEGTVQIRTFPDVKDKTDYARADAGEKIKELLSAGKNVYAFFSQRRDVMMFADMFAAQNPVLYTAYHKGESRADAVLLNQKVTDTQLLLATSAAGIGININDPNAETVIIIGAIYGQLNLSTIIQETVRNRARTNVTIYAPLMTTSQPIAPAEAEAVSLYEQELKIRLKTKYKVLPEDAIKRHAHSMSLATLADNDPMTFFRHHIESVAGMKVVETHVDFETIPVAHVDRIKDVRSQTRKDELDDVEERILEILDAPTLQVMTSTQIRADGTAGELTPMPIEQLAQERFNNAAQALGWDDTETDDFSFIDKSLLKELCLTIRNYDELNQQRKGWLSVHYNEWTHQQFEQNLEKNQHKDGLTAEQGALEITDIEDNRIEGALLTQLLQTLKGNPYTETTLAQTVREILNMRHGNDTFLTLIQNGALGIKGYKAARFLHIASDEGIVEWTRKFVRQWYPVRIAKKKDHYYLKKQKNAELKTRVFQKWLDSKSETPEDDPDGHSPPFIDGFCEPPDPRSGQKAHAKQIVTEGRTAKAAAEITGLPYNLVCKITRDIRDTAKNEQRETSLKLLTEGNSTQDVATQLGVNKSTIHRRGKEETKVTCKVTSLQDPPLNSNYKKYVLQKNGGSCNDVTLQNQILKALSDGEKRTGDIIESVVGQYTAIKNELKRLVDSRQIVKVKHGVYSLPQVSNEIEQTQREQDEQLHPEHVSYIGARFWSAIYLIHNSLFDKQMHTREEIAARSGVAQEICNTSLDFMHENGLVNVGVGDTFYMDSDAQKRCFYFVLSQTRNPDLLISDFCLSTVLDCMGLIRYWTGEWKINMIEKVKAKGLIISDFDKFVSNLDAYRNEQVAGLKKKLDFFERAAAEYNKKSLAIKQKELELFVKEWGPANCTKTNSRQ